MEEALRTIALAVAAAALVLEVLGRRGRGRMPLVELLRDLLVTPRADGALVFLAACAGIVSVGLPVVLGTVSGWLHPSRVGSASGIGWLTLAAGSLLLKTVWVVFEEVVFRGSLQKRLAAGLGVRLAVLVAAAVFAAAHAGRGPLDSVVLLLDGIAFGLVFAATGDLKPAVAWHLAKNVTVWAVYGRGTLDLVPGPVEVTATGPALWTGAGGAGLLDVLATLAVLAPTVLWFGSVQGVGRGGHVPDAAHRRGHRG